LVKQGLIDKDDKQMASGLPRSVSK